MKTSDYLAILNNPNHKGYTHSFFCFVENSTSILHLSLKRELENSYLLLGTTFSTLRGPSTCAKLFRALPLVNKPVTRLPAQVGSQY